jgi:SAM-dependent methyltransferase
MTTGIWDSERFHRFVRARFGQPRGWSGRVAGVLLAGLNGELNRRAVDALGLSPSSRVLEIGYGPGVGIAALLSHVTAGHVAGIDPSAEMLHQAATRNRAAFAQGQLDLRLGFADALPWNDATFDAALSLNSLLFWQPLEPSLGEVFRVLRPGGRFLVGFHELAAQGQAAPGEGSLDAVEQRLGALLSGAGFRPVASQRVRLRLGRGMWVIVERPGGAVDPAELGRVSGTSSAKG